ncbi:MAG: DUF3828 domain-containing protein [Aridibacter sp.]
MKKGWRVTSRKWRVVGRKVILCCLLLTAYCLLLSCSQPVLESPECIASRDSVKRFYSFHFGNDMKPSAKNLEKREKYLSKELKAKLANQSETAKDYFTQTADYPKAFRVGKCKTLDKNRTKFEILLFWRTDEKNIQREIDVEAVKENNKWLINKVTAKN